MGEGYLKSQQTTRVTQVSTDTATAGKVTHDPLATPIDVYNSGSGDKGFKSRILGLLQQVSTDTGRAGMSNLQPGDPLLNPPGAAETNVLTWTNGKPSWATGGGMTNPMTTTGDTIYSNPGSTPVRLPIGSAGQVLTVAGGVPTWAAAAGGTTAIWEQIWNYLAANNSDPVDTLISSGNYRVFIYFASQNAAAWKDATNAVYTVAAGKTLKVVYTQGAGITSVDFPNRRARFRNTTDAVDVIEQERFAVTQLTITNSHFGHGFPWQGDVAEVTQFPTVAANKTVKMGIWNVDANRRASGGIVIAIES